MTPGAMNHAEWMAKAQYAVKFSCFVHRVGPRPGLGLNYSLRAWAGLGLMNFCGPGGLGGPGTNC